MEDAQIVAPYWARDEAAVAETDAAHGRFCRAMAQNLLGIAADAEECVNDTYLAAWSAMPTERPARLRPWLGRVVRNIAVDRWRHDHAGKRYAGVQLLLDELEDCVPDPGTVERESVGHKPMFVNLTVPKFDVSSDLDLREGLWAMGVRDVFDWEVSDFSPMTADVDEVYLTQATQASRVTVDEEGCTAAAYVQFGLAAGAAAPPDDEIDFTLDRPFLFVITGNDGLPLFVGIVNRPAA